MATPRKQPARTRTLRLADGGLFRIGPGTVSVPVSTLPLDPPAVVLHVNRSCGALELVPDATGTTPPPQRVDAARVLAIVEQINVDRFNASMRGGRAEPPVELPPTLRSTARHVAAWRQQNLPFVLEHAAVGYPSKTQRDHTLWIHRETGKAILETFAVQSPGSNVRFPQWDELTPRRAAEWLADNGYTSIPATLQLRRGKDDAPQRKRGKGRK